MLRLKDPILNEPGSPDGIELPALHEPDSIDMRSSSRARLSDDRFLSVKEEKAWQQTTFAFP